MARPIAARVDELVTRELTKITDPAKRAVAAHELAEALSSTRATVSAIRGGAIRDLRRDGGSRTWDAIGELLGVTRQRAEQLARPTIEEALTP